MQIRRTTRCGLERLTLAAVFTLPLTACSGSVPGTPSNRDSSKLDPPGTCAPEDEFCNIPPQQQGTGIPAGGGVPIDSPADPSLPPGIEASYSPDDGVFTELHYAPDDGQHQPVSFCDAYDNPIPPPSEEELNTPPPENSNCLGVVGDMAHCPVDPSTLTDQACSSDSDCESGVCGARCNDAQCLDVSHFCGQHAASCYGIPPEFNCEDYNLCAEDGAVETPDTHAEHDQELQEQLTGTSTSAEVPDSQKTTVPEYDAVGTSFCTYWSDVGDLHDSASKPALETPKKKWGVYMDHSLDYGMKPAKNPNWITELQDLHGSGKFAIGAIIWGNKLEALDAEASAVLTDCGVDLLVTARLFGESVVALTAEAGKKFNADLIAPGRLGTPEAARSTCESAKEQAKNALNEVRQTNVFAREVAQYYNDNSLTPELCRAIISQVPLEEKDALGGDFVCDDLENMPAGRRIDILDAIKKDYDVKSGNYPNYADALGVAHQQVEMNGTLDVFDVKPDKPYDLKILDMDFPIGPIDLNLAVEGYGSWNIKGGLQWGLGFSTTFDPSLAGVSDVLHDGVPSLGDIRAFGGPVFTPSMDLGVLAFVGVGIPGLSVGIEGQIDIFNAQLPMSAVAAAMRVSEDDHRNLGASAFAGNPKPGMAPKNYRWVLGYNFGATLDLHELDGKLDLAVRLHILFFKKTFRAHLFNWTGFGQTYPLVAGAGTYDPLPYQGDLGEQGDSVAYTEIPGVPDAEPRIAPQGPVPIVCNAIPE